MELIFSMKFKLISNTIFGTEEVENDDGTDKVKVPTHVRESYFLCVEEKAF